MKFNFLRLCVALFVLFSLVQCKKDESSVATISSKQLVVGGLNVELNPTSIAPLSALLTFTSEVPTNVSISVLGNPTLTHLSPVYTFNHAESILGLYPDTVNTVVITIYDQKNRASIDTLQITTEALYNGIPEISVITNTEGNSNLDLYLADLHFGNSGAFTSFPIVFDATGTIRWCLDLRNIGEITWPVRELQNGNILFGFETGVFEYNKLGYQINYWPTPGYRPHHEVVEMPNGNILVAVEKAGTNIVANGQSIASTDDHIIELKRGSGSIVQVWDLREYLDVDRVALSDGMSDWFHMNGIAYSPKDDCIIASGRNQALIKVNRNNELVWIMAPHKGWGNGGADGNGAPTEPYLLTAVNNSGFAYNSSIQNGDVGVSDFDWPWGQHSPEVLENGNIMLFDNGFNRFFQVAPSYSRAVEYAVNESNKTVRQVWTYGQSYGSSCFSPIISSAYVDSYKNTVSFAPGFISDNGTRAKVIEVDYTGKNIQFEANLEFKNLTSSGVFAWGTIDIVYRIKKVKLI